MAACSTCKYCGQNPVWCTCLPDPAEEAVTLEADVQQEEEPEAEGDPPAAAASPPPRQRREKEPVECASCGQRFVWCACSPTTGHRSATSATSMMCETSHVDSGGSGGGGSGGGSTESTAQLSAGGESGPLQGQHEAVQQLAEPEALKEPDINRLPAPSPPQTTLYWGHRHQDKDFGVRLNATPTLYLLPGLHVVVRPWLMFHLLLTL